MGTRNLTMIQQGGKMVVAQYGQWDGYPSGQGSTVARFIREVLLDPEKKAAFLKKLARIKFIDEEKKKEIDAFLKSIGSNDGGLTGAQAELYHQKYPLLTRDNGAKVLFLIHDMPEGDEPIWVHDQTDFAGDSLFNEWSYLINLDTNELELYKGFNKKPLNKDQRFKYLEPMLKAELVEIKKKCEAEGRPPYRTKVEYFPIKCYGKISLDEVPADNAGWMVKVNSLLPKNGQGY